MDTEQTTDDENVDYLDLKNLLPMTTTSKCPSHYVTNTFEFSTIRSTLVCGGCHGFLAKWVGNTDMYILGDDVIYSNLTVKDVT